MSSHCDITDMERTLAAGADDEEDAEALVSELDNAVAAAASAPPPDAPLLPELDRLVVARVGAARAARADGSVVTLTYAQSLDGCIAAGEGGAPLLLSGPESMTMTHALRAAHACICVGVGTVLADDPSLTVRRVSGQSPRPVVFDSRLRTPVAARLLSDAQPHPPLLLCAAGADPARRRALEAAGAEVAECRGDEAGRLDLAVAVASLRRRFGSVMVEGGAGIITAVWAARLADLAVITTAPVLVGGLHAFAHPGGAASVRLADPAWVRAGEDAVVVGLLS